MSKVTKAAWMDELIGKNGGSSDAVKVNWVLPNKAYSKDLVFKLCPSNSKEKGVFTWVIGTHWNLGEDKKFRFTCPEKSSTMKDIVCPFCAAKRKLMSMGFTAEELTVPGKYGSVGVFDPLLTSNVKGIVIRSDLANPNADTTKHIGVIQIKGDFSSKWIIEKVIDEDSPDFMSWEESIPFKFSRKEADSKWEREYSFKKVVLEPHEIERLKAENEELTCSDIWKAPDDEALLQARMIADQMVTAFIDARNAKEKAVKQAIEDRDNDEIPF